MHFNWLHLTDLHFGLKGQGCLWPNLRQPFLDSLSDLHARCGPWHAVLFTGDLVQSGAPEQFTRMQAQVLDPLWQRLAELGSGDACLLAVPGNHDLARPDPRKDAPAVHTLLEPGGFQRVAERFWDEPNGSYREAIRTAFAPYTAWWASAPHRPPNPIDGALPGDFAVTLDLAGRSLGIIGLNTAFLQLQGGDYEKRLVWSPAQLEALLPDGVDRWLGERDLCLLLTHHGPDWLTPEAQDQGLHEIAPPGRFALHLFGHMHETALSYVRRGASRDATRLCQGCSVFGLERYGEPPTTRRAHGYLAGRLQIDGADCTFRLWPRIATNKIGGWRFVPDHDHAVLERDEGTAAEPIACLPRQPVPAAGGPGPGPNGGAPQPAPTPPATVSAQTGGVSSPATPKAPPSQSAPPPGPTAFSDPMPALKPGADPRQGTPVAGVDLPGARSEPDRPGDEPSRAVYVSYNWNAPIQAIVDRLEAECAARGIALRRDTSQIRYGDSIRQYMQELGAGGAVAVVVSEAYLKSPNCMYELLEIEKNGRFRERVQPVVVRQPGELNLFDALDRVKLVKHWEDRAHEIEAAIATLSQKDHLGNVYRELDLARDIRRLFDYLTGILSDMNALTPQAHLDSQFEALIARVLSLLAPAVLAPAPATLGQATRDDLHPAPELVKQIDHALDGAAMQPLRRSLVQALDLASESGLGEVLCTKKTPTEALKALRDAADDCLGQLPEERRSGALQTGCRLVLGWLLARCVIADRPEDPFAAEITLGTDAAAEVYWLRWFGDKHPPELKVTDGRLVGKHNVRGGAGATEAGWSWEAYVHGEKLALWKRLLPDRSEPRVFGKDEDRALLEQINFVRNRAGVTRLYCTVDRGHSRNPIDDPNVVKALREDLRMPILFLDASRDTGIAGARDAGAGDGDESVRLCMSEETLRGYIRRCLEAIEGPAR